MLIPILVLLTIVFWVGTIAAYFRIEIYRWFDNRYGPVHRAERPPRIRKRLYD